MSQEAWAEFERIQLGILQNKLAENWWVNRETPYSKEYTEHIDKVRLQGADWKPQITARGPGGGT